MCYVIGWLATKAMCAFLVVALMSVYTRVES
jgi:hypothetical protein